MPNNTYTFIEKVEILKRNLEKRLAKLPEFKEGLQNNLKVFAEKRNAIVSRLDKFNDELILEMLKNNLDYIDTQYEKEIAEMRIEIERLDNSVPIIKTFISQLEEVLQYPNTYKILESFIDLFLERTLDDWVELEKLELEKLNETTTQQ
jgi:hypothetical protein